MDFYLRNDECEEAILVVVSIQSQWAESQKVEVRKLKMDSDQACPERSRRVQSQWSVSRFFILNIEYRMLKEK